MTPSIPARPRIYVAAASAELPRAEAAIRELRAIGADVVGDWTAAVARWGSEGDGQTDKERSAQSAQQLRHVIGCDALLALVPTADLHTRGLWMEAGAAYAAAVPVVASCAAPRLPWMLSWAEHVATDAVAIGRVLRRAHEDR